MNTWTVTALFNRDRKALEQLGNTIQCDAMAVPALILNTMVNAITTKFKSKYKEKVVEFLGISEDKPLGDERQIRINGPQMETMMTQTMMDLQNQRGGEQVRLRARLSALSRTADMMKWTTKEGHLNEHVKAMLWKLARILVQDMWGRNAPRSSLYDLLWEAASRPEINLSSTEEVSQTSVDRREREFLQAGKSMKKFWEETTLNYGQRFKDPLKLERKELHRFVSTMRDVQLLCYVNDGGKPQPDGHNKCWLWEAPDAYWDVCFTIHTLRRKEGLPSRALVQATLARYRTVAEEIKFCHDLTSWGVGRGDSNMWASYKVKASHLVAQEKEQLQQQAALAAAQAEDAAKKGSKKRKRRAVLPLEPPLDPLRMQPEEKRRKRVQESLGRVTEMLQSETPLQQEQRVQLRRPTSPSWSMPPGVSVMCMTEGRPRDSSSVRGLRGADVIGVNVESSAEFRLHHGPGQGVQDLLPCELESWPGTITPDYGHGASSSVLGPW